MDVTTKSSGCCGCGTATASQSAPIDLPGEGVTFRVEDMTCGHCAGVLSKALKSVDAAARVDVDLQRRTIRVESSAADADELESAIREAGYTPARG